MTQIRSEIPGAVWQVKIAEGDQVDAGDELIILESMKMEIPVIAPIGGTVSALHVKPDDRVQEGDLLAELA
jgi:acetyl-CoA carboxylase biotin carboxyl carrier protein